MKEFDDELRLTFDHSWDVLVLNEILEPVLWDLNERWASLRRLAENLKAGIFVIEREHYAWTRHRILCDLIGRRVMDRVEPLSKNEARLAVGPELGRVVEYLIDHPTYTPGARLTDLTETEYEALSTAFVNAAATTSSKSSVVNRLRHKLKELEPEALDLMR